MTPNGLFGLLSSVSCGAFALATDQTVVFWNRRAREILGYTPDLVVGRRCSGLARAADGAALTDDCKDGCLMVRSLRAGLVPGRARLRMRCSSGAWKWLVVTPMVVSGMEDGGPLLVYLFGDSGEAAEPADIQRLIELGCGAGRLSGEGRYVGSDSFLPDPPATATLLRDDEPSLRIRQDLESGQNGNGHETDFREMPRGSPGPMPSEADQSGEELHPEPEPREVHLTEREREALSYLALGWETKYIAEEMGVSWYTARNHIENLRGKLGASTRLEAVMVAMRLGIIPSE